MTSTTASEKKVHRLMEKASAALAATRYFEAERLAEEALRAAHAAGDLELINRILLPLQEARRQRFQLAMDAADGHIVILDEPLEEEFTVEPGCYLVRPPLVGADARRLRVAAMEQEVPVAVICREPLTQLGFWPIVAIGPGHTVRTRVDPPDNPEAPDMAWFAETMEAFGDFAIDSIDCELAPHKRLNILVERQAIIPEHERLHRAVAEASDALAESLAEEAAEKARKKAARESGD